MTVKGKTNLQVVTDILADLEHPDVCCFWACPGPDARFVSMATCRVCAGIQDLRKIKRRLEDTP